MMVFLGIATLDLTQSELAMLGEEFIPQHLTLPYRIVALWDVVLMREVLCTLCIHDAQLPTYHQTESYL